MISKRLEKLSSSSSLIREMFEEGKRLTELYGKENVFDYSLGNPSTRTPHEVKQSIIDCLMNFSEKELHGYMSNSGFPSVRKAVADDLKKRFSVPYDENCIIMTVGAAGGLNCVLQTLLNPNDEVIVISPFFTEYGNYISNWQGKMVIVEADEPSFRLPIERIAGAITKNTRAIIVNNPNNPTGVVYSSEEINGLSEVLKAAQAHMQTSIYIISDEPYREICYEKMAVPFIPSYYENTIIVYSWSKSLSLPGERIGYIAISPNASDNKLLFSSMTVSNRIIGFVNAPSLIQLVVAKCLDVPINICEYERNRQYLCKELKRIGYSFVIPQGAFYLWLKTPCDEISFVNKAKKHNLLLVPGTAFCGKGYVRLAYCVDYQMIERSISAFERLWNDIGGMQGE